jgi:3-dehydroquinate dehydratase type I
MARKAERALELGSDVVEFRIDHLENPHPHAITEGLSRFSESCVLTVRSKEQGGHFRGPDEERLHLLEEICGAMKPAFLDVEIETVKRFDMLIGSVSRMTGQMILSWHDFQGTPEPAELVKRYEEMRKLSPKGGIVKMVTFAKGPEDNLRILSLYGRKRNKKPVAFCMGERGMFSRVLSYYAGSPLAYVALPGEQVAPGQLSIVQMRELIRIIG